MFKNYFLEVNTVYPIKYTLTSHKSKKTACCVKGSKTETDPPTQQAINEIEDNPNNITEDVDQPIHTDM